jgi:hypothetical protein
MHMGWVGRGDILCHESLLCMHQCEFGKTQHKQTCRYRIQADVQSYSTRPSGFYQLIRLLPVAWQYVP